MGETPPRPPSGVLASCAWRRESTTSYALEGFVPAAGAALDWFARIGALPGGRELDVLLASAGSRDPGVVCVPALQGFGSPTWDAGAQGALLGLSLGTSRADLARAVVDGILHQVADAAEAMSEAVTLGMLWVDGGLSRSDWIVQRLADLAGVRVQRTARADSTALGAATLAGLAAGVWDRPEALAEIPLDLVAEPELAPGRAHARARALGRGAGAQLTLAVTGRRVIGKAWSQVGAPGDTQGTQLSDHRSHVRGAARDLRRPPTGHAECIPRVYRPHKKSICRFFPCRRRDSNPGV